MKPQHGDSIAIYNPFVWNNIVTYLSAIIRFFTKSHYNHMESIVEIDGVLYSFGALEQGYTKRTIEDFLIGKKLTNLLVLRPNFNFDKEIFKNTAISFVGKKYSYEGTLFFQLIYQVTKERLWIGYRIFKNATRKLYCSEAVSCLYFMSGYKVFENYYEIDPADLVNSNDFTKFNFTN